jgi:hypothetical protein
MAPADFSMSKNRETEFAHPVPIGHQEGVVGEVSGVAAPCHSRKKDSETTMGRMKNFQTPKMRIPNKMKILKTHKMMIQIALKTINKSKTMQFKHKQGHTQENHVNSTTIATGWAVITGITQLMGGHQLTKAKTIIDLNRLMVTTICLGSLTFQI